MGKRILLFLATNLVVMITLSIVLSLLGYSGYISPQGQLQLVPLMILCLVWGMGGSFISLAMSRWIAKRSVGATLIDGRTGNADFDWVYNTVARMAQQSNLPMPEVAVYDSPEVNAFATGPSKKRSLVAVSTGLLRNVDRRGVEGVLGHELAHIANGDMVTMTLLQGVINAFVMFFARIAAFLVRQTLDSRIAGLVSFIVMIGFEIVFGILGSMITAWYSRQREFRADAGGAALAGRDSMIGALQQLKRQQEMIDPSTPALAAYKIAGGKSWMKLFSTHPDLDLRIAALQAGR
jgi:heat shock protein HtpX